MLINDVERLSLEVHYLCDRVAAVEEWVLAWVHGWRARTQRRLLVSKSQVRRRL